MKREVHETRTRRVWKTDSGRVLLTMTGDRFTVDAHQCDEIELQALQSAIQEALAGWGTSPFTEFRDGVPLLTKGKFNAVPIEKTG